MSKFAIAAALKRLRERTGMKADDVGALIGKSGKTVNAWENGRGQPDVDMLIALCDIYGVDDILAEFRAEDEEKAPPSDESNDEALANMINFIRDGLVAGGFLRDGEDIDERSAKVLIAVIKALFE